MTDDERSARDTAHRSLALDTRHSFLVQAPAGSGKTELLIQRYLALLANVERPERVVAMTFTVKAAAEMRERIVAALREVGSATPPRSAHEAKTRELARAVLARDDAEGWQLVAHPARLAVYTIDALCASIARQAPITSGLGAMPRLIERADPLYREAAREALAAATADDADWRVLLEQLDNDAQRVVELVASMLAKRDQWLRHLGQPDPLALRRALEQALQHEIDAVLTRTDALFGIGVRATLARCAAYAAANLAHDGGDAAFAEALARCAQQGGLPPATWNHHDDWRALANWLLTANDPQLRERMDKRQGFPPKGKPPGADERQRRKDEIVELLDLMSDERGIADALHVVRSLPPPVYDETSWAMVAALLKILPRAVAWLQVTFAAHGATDFAECTLASLRALGNPEEPSDLLLRLDLRIDHLLIDEFQDTSDIQYALLSRLTAGWTPGDGRTLFAVGDPMQSIYRFREAEVRLFLEAQARSSIGDVPVRFIDLARNFRSQAHIVAWVNAVFPSVLAPVHNPWSGAVAFAASVAAHAAIPGIAPTLDLVATPEAEAASVVARVTAALDAGSEDVAILVRARAVLVPILPALRAAGIDFAAVELDPLGARQSVLDLVSLAHALLQPADRLATLAVLRAPWCGLMLADLVAIAPHAAQGLEALLARRAELAGVGDDGLQRLDRLALALLPAYAERGRGPLTPLVRGAWLALGGPATVDEAIDLDAAESFFALLREHERAGDVRDWNLIVDALAQMHVAPTAAASPRVKVMTLHRAKGLEFDTVILPGLARVHEGDSAELLRWRARPQGLLLAPMNARGGGDDRMYAYLSMLASAESDHELGRLLYVGATRAKTRLHLVACADVAEGTNSGPREWKAPKSTSALGKLWDALASQRSEPAVNTNAAQTAFAAAPPPLRRFTRDFVLPSLPASARSPTAALTATAPAMVPFEWAHATAAAIGTVTHRLLAQLAREGLAAWERVRGTSMSTRIRRALRSEGVDETRLSDAAGEVERALARLLADPRGRWLFDPTHADAASEWALAGVDAGAVVHVSLDRTFVADGVRWIVDFKTGRHEGGDAAAFLAREEERYRPQLERYARIVRAIDPRPIRLALYYPLVEQGWREWAFAP